MRETRYQGAIVSGTDILLIQHREIATGRTFWTLPGGGRNPDETEEACIVREMREETCLDVRVERLLLDLPDSGRGPYQNRRTYLCRVAGGQPSPGNEPEDAEGTGSPIVDIAWLDLTSETTWCASVTEDAITYPLLLAIRKALAIPAGGRR